MRYKPSAALLANHDFVLLGYRGVDGSLVLDCPEVTEAMKGIEGESGDISVAQADRECGVGV